MAWSMMNSAPLDGTVVELACRLDDGTLYRLFGYFVRDVDDEGDGWTDGTVASWDYQENCRIEPIAWRERQPLTEAEVYEGWNDSAALSGDDRENSRRV